MIYIHEGDVGMDLWHHPGLFAEIVSFMVRKRTFLALKKAMTDTRLFSAGMPVLYRQSRRKRSRVRSTNSHVCTNRTMGDARVFNKGKRIQSGSRKAEEVIETGNLFNLVDRDFP